MIETWKSINLLLKKRSKTTNMGSLEVGQDAVDSNNIAQSRNKFFCSVVHKLSDNTPYQANPLLSNEGLRPSLLLMWKGL